MCLMRVWCIIETFFIKLKTKHHLLTGFAILKQSLNFSQIISFKVEFEPNILRKSLTKLCCYYYYSVILRARIPQQCQHLTWHPQVCPLLHSWHILASWYICFISSILTNASFSHWHLHCQYLFPSCASSCSS